MAGMSRERDYIHVRRRTEAGVLSGRLGLPRQTKGEAVLLADVLATVIGGPLAIEQKRLTQMHGLWDELVPQELRGHCKVVGFTKGVVKVQADLPTYAYQLRLCGNELLAKLRERPGLSTVSELKIILVGRN